VLPDKEDSRRYIAIRKIVGCCEYFASFSGLSLNHITHRTTVKCEDDYASEKVVAITQFSYILIFHKLADVPSTSRQIHLYTNGDSGTTFGGECDNSDLYSSNQERKPSPRRYRQIHP
jgi:hypothetical protein